jgi:hypothetical protein
VSAAHGAKQSGSAAGPLTISGSAIAVELSMMSAVAANRPPSSDLIIRYSSQLQFLLIALPVEFRAFLGAHLGCPRRSHLASSVHHHW